MTNPLPVDDGRNKQSEKIHRVVESILSHHAPYGWETPLKNPASLILMEPTESGQRPIFMHRPSRLTDEVWQGDCSSTFPYSLAVLLQADILGERQSFNTTVLDGRFNLTHYRTVVRDGESVHPIEFSAFFGSLKWPPGSERIDRLDVGEIPKVQPNTILDFSKGYFYKEFTGADSLIAMAVALSHRIDPELGPVFQFEFSFYEQTAGEVTVHRQFDTTLPAGYFDERGLRALTPTNLVALLNNAQAVVIKSGTPIGEYLPLPVKHVEEVAHCIPVIAAAIVRGQNPGSIAEMQKLVMEPMRGDPINWWK